MNQTHLTATLAQVQSLRYTPAGVPALEMRLEHSAVVSEAETERQVKLGIKAVALGMLAETLANQDVGKSFLFKGFLHSPRQQQVVFHIQAFESI